MPETRTGYVKKNILWGNISNIVLTVLSFVSRTVFIYVLGAKYLGVSGLFTNILGILSFSELGIGSAINYSLYKPIAEKDNEKIIALMKLYKTAYRIIAVVVATLGVILFPFLEYFVNTDIPMNEIRVFYLIFLFNTVSSYFVTYKTSYVSALQKNYVVTNINTLGQIATYIAQLICIWIIPDYTLYLLVQAVIGLLQKVIMSWYINNKYPILKERGDYKVDEPTKKELVKNVKALVIHKVGEVCVHQTDNIVISVFINTLTVGVMSNYIMLNATIEKFTGIIFNSFTASFGNLIAKENKEKQREIFELYDFMGFWIYGFVFIAFVTLSQPFISLWLGEKMLVDNFTMILYFVCGYLTGQCVVTYNFKVAAGKFNEDKWVAFVQSFVNIVVSITAVKMIGLPGVYVGTIAQRLIVNVVRPITVYKYVLKQSSLIYFRRFLLRGSLVASIAYLMSLLSKVVLVKLTWGSFLLMTILTAILPNVIILLIYGRSDMFKSVIARLRK